MQNSVSVHIDLSNVKYENVKGGIVKFVLGNDFLCFKLYITSLYKESSLYLTLGVVSAF